MYDRPDNLEECLEYLITKTDGFRQHLKSQGKDMKYSEALVVAIAMLQEELSVN